MLEEKVLRTNGHIVVYTKFNNNSKSVIFLFHGFLGQKENLYSLAEEISKLGFDVVIPDMYAHGESDGNIENFTISRVIKDYEQLIEKETKGYEKWCIFGYSIGGFIALKLLDKKPSCVVLGAPMVSFKETFAGTNHEVWRNTGMIIDENLGLSLNIKYRFYEDGLEWEDKNRTSKIPIYVIHGKNDRVIKIEQLKNLKGITELNEIETEHNIFEDPTTKTKIIEWIKKVIGSK